ncbi:MAG: hypothetical protein H7829_04530 [Magnetococcus sp. THC-1_WYH]
MRKSTDIGWVMRIFIVLSILWFLIVFADKSSNVIGLGVLPLAILWGIYWIISGVMSSGKKMTSNKPYNIPSKENQSQLPQALTVLASIENDTIVDMVDKATDTKDDNLYASGDNVISHSQSTPTNKEPNHIKKIEKHLGSSFAILFGLLMTIVGITQLNNNLIAGVTTILGALAFRSAKQRKLKNLSNSRLRKSLELVSIASIVLIVTMQNNLKMLIISDPVPVLIVPVITILFYLYAVIVIPYYNNQHENDDYSRQFPKN